MRAGQNVSVWTKTRAAHDEKNAQLGILGTQRAAHAEKDVRPYAPTTTRSCVERVKGS